MWPPLRPSKKSRSTCTGRPSRPRPIGSGRPISSAYSAFARSSPVARSTASPGSGETQISGSTRVTATCADRTFAAGMMPSSAIRCVSDSNEAPSYTASTSVTTPYVRTSPAFGTCVRTTTRSSNWRYSLSSMTTRNAAVFVCSDPRTRPTRSSLTRPPASRRRAARDTRAAGRPSGGAAPARGPRSARGSAERAGPRVAPTRRSAGSPPCGRRCRGPVRAEAGRCASHRTMPVHEWPPASVARRTYQEYRL